MNQVMSTIEEHPSAESGANPMQAMIDEMRLLRKEVAQLRNQQTENAPQRLDLGRTTSPRTSTSTEPTELEARADTPLSMDQEIDSELLNGVEEKVEKKRLANNIHRVGGVPKVKMSPLDRPEHLGKNHEGNDIKNVGHSSSGKNWRYLLSSKSGRTCKCA